jgi:hypothetical protein
VAEYRVKPEAGAEETSQLKTPLGVVDGVQRLIQRISAVIVAIIDRITRSFGAFEEISREGALTSSLFLEPTPLVAAHETLVSAGV